MSRSANIDLAVAYVALSNAHRTDLIIHMFDEDACYHSHQVGKFQGPREIVTMMTKFFTQYPDVRWTVPAYNEVEENIVRFSFVMTAKKNDEQIERSGVEIIEFSANGLISRLEVNPECE